MGAGILLISASAHAQPAAQPAPQQDILLPAADAPPLTGMDEATPDPELPPVTPAVAPDPSALTAPVDPSASQDAQDSMDDLLKKIDAGAQQVQAPAPTVPEVTPEQSNVAPPTDEKLASPEDVTAAPVTPPASTAPGTMDAAGAASAAPDAKDVAAIPALPAADKPDENLFFDADNLVPEGEMGTKSGPRKVNPALQPASKLIVVTKDYNKNSREAQLVSAERAVALGRYDSALEMYNAMYEKNNRDPNILMGRAVALQHLGQDEEAVHAYEELLDLRPDNVQAQVNMLGLMGQRYPAVGLQRLADLHNKNPDDVSIIGQMAVLSANMGNYDDAIKYLGVAASMEPHNANHLYNMAVIADRAGKRADAIKLYEDALETDTIYGGGRSIPRDAVYDRLARLR
jgi:Flp pilus assembly protein TadD